MRSPQPPEGDHIGSRECGSSWKQYVSGAGLVSQVDGASTYYYLADGLGSTMKTIDASGNVVNDYTYDVYGEVTNSSGSQANEFDFTGQQTDPTGLQYLRARYYDTETGIFISRDHVSPGPSGRANPYDFSGANPIRFTDPTGLDKCSWHDPLECTKDATAAAIDASRRTANTLIGIAGTSFEAIRSTLGDFASDIKGAVDEIRKSLDKMSDSFRGIVSSVLDHLMGDLFRLVEKADVLARSCIANKTDCAGGLSIMALGYVSALSMTAVASAACASSGVACVLLIPAVYSANMIRKEASQAGMNIIIWNDPQRLATP